MAAVLANLEAELGVIGCALYESSFVERIPDLKPEHFAEDLHAEIYRSILEKIAAKEPVDVTFLAARFENAFLPDGYDLNAPSRVYRFFSDLIDRAPSTTVGEAMASNIMDAAQRRAVIELSARMRDAAHDPMISAFDTVSKGEVSLTAMIQASAPASHSLVWAREAAGDTVMRLRVDRDTGHTKGAMTGLRCFDQRTRGIQPGHLIVIGGRPSMGKTSLARAAALGCARRNPDKLVVYFCLEMDRDEMSLRTLSQLTREAGKGIPYFDMEGVNLNNDKLRLLEGLAETIPTNFILDDSSSLSMDHITRRLYSLTRGGKKIAAVFVDYLQIMDMPSGQYQSRTQAVGDITGAMKRLAKAMGFGMVALSQLSRGVESRDDKRPQLSDLRDSGSVEQDANVVMFPYREAYYLERQAMPKDMDPLVYENRIETMKGKMEVITAKFRGGSIGSDMQKYLPAFDLIVNEDEEIMPWEDAD